MAAVKIRHFTVSKTPVTGVKQFTLNIRREIIKKPIYKRGKKAISAVKEMTAKAMHTNPEHVKICNALNLHIWSQGKHNPPTRFKVHSKMFDDFALVELQGVDFPKQKEKAAKEPKSLKEKIAEKLAQSKATETNKELKKEELAVEKKEHMHEAHHAPGHTKTEQQNKEDKIKGTVTQDKKKELGGH